MADVIELVEKATEKGTFSILDAARGIGYPKDTVDVYTDIEAAYLIKHYNTQAANELDPEKVDEAEQTDGGQGEADITEEDSNNGENETGGSV